MAIDQARETALKILYDINQNNAYSNLSINKYLESGNLTEIDRAFVTDLVYGTVKWLLQIDYVIGSFSSLKLKKLSPWILNILRLGAYQLLHTDKIPVSAACNTSVDLAKRYGHQASSRFVNAVLRNISKNRDSLPLPDKTDIAEYLSIVYSYPKWLVEKWISLFGAEFTEELMISNKEVPEFTVRVNTLKTSRSELLELLHKDGIAACEGKYLEEAVILENPSSIARLEAFKKGYLQVQDESSMLAGRILDPQKGELIIDICSAPGGKATHMAQLMKNTGTVIARDVHPHKLKLIEDSAARLGIDIIETELFDACELDEGLMGRADRVLVDVPCSGFGIIRKKPDIKYSKSQSEINNIIALQRKILNNASKYLKVGGCMVYSTCTILPEENIENVMSFLNENGQFELDGFEQLMPEGIRIKSASEGYIQLFPNINQTDGFFVSKIIRKR